MIYITYIAIHINQINLQQIIFMLNTKTLNYNKSHFIVMHNKSLMIIVIITNCLFLMYELFNKINCPYLNLF